MVMRPGQTVAGDITMLAQCQTGGSMKAFHCSRCDELVFFESSTCLRCRGTLAYLPDRGEIGTLEALTEPHWRRIGSKARCVYRLCRNYSQEHVCNWAVSAHDPNPYCLSCRLNRIIPNLSQPETYEPWGKIEAAKRRMVYSLLCLGLPISSKEDDPEHGLAFEFLADPEPGTPEAAPVRTGHLDGVITINLAEADDAERERRRVQMHEPYRTLLGHFRHEIGHYYWDRLIQGSDRLDEFRAVFGDDRDDYGQRLAHHHEHGAPVDWPKSFVSAYASAHPWEDWAESWAHYLHILDTLESALCTGVSIQPRRINEPVWKANLEGGAQPRQSFDQMIEGWFPLTYVLNNLNRCMGLQDAYPFVLSTPVLHKLRFVHESIQDSVARLRSGANGTTLFDAIRRVWKGKSRSA